ncbi:hypothetical protein EV127DRAFT_111979 [Xylaria flabelliformis]|nr:hypothetical protein EV127DRAFT_111979 [Xylaria flabelliformis]
MYNSKFLLALAALADASLAQTFPDPACASLTSELLLAAPTIPAAVVSAFGGQSGIPSVENLLSHPDTYVEEICNIVGVLPSSVIPEFAGWGSSLLNYASVEISSYDAVVTKCITTGTAAASITSFIHSIASAPGALCQPTSTSAPSGGNSTAHVTQYSTYTPYPTATHSGNSTTNHTGVPTTSIPTAAAARPTGAFVGAAAIGGLLGAVALL